MFLCLGAGLLCVRPPLPVQAYPPVRRVLRPALLLVLAPCSPVRPALRLEPPWQRVRTKASWPGLEPKPEPPAKSESQTIFEDCCFSPQNTSRPPDSEKSFYVTLFQRGVTSTEKPAKDDQKALGSFRFRPVGFPFAREPSPPAPVVSTAVHAAEAPSLLRSQLAAQPSGYTASSAPHSAFSPRWAAASIASPSSSGRVASHSRHAARCRTSASWCTAK